MADDKTSRTVRRKRRKLKKRAYFILIPLILLLAAGSWLGYIYTKADSVLSDSYEDHGRDKSELRNQKVDPKFDNVSVLVMGVDSSEKRRENNDSALTDTLMLATLNKDDKSVKLLSIPRDSYVYIPEVDRTTKINHAHAYGGPTATIDAVENLMDIPVDYYVKVNFEAFVETVEALNGITVDVPYEFRESNSNDKRDAIHLTAGEQTLNGEEALALARTRKHDNDIERGKRQQDIIKAAMKKATSISSILKFDNILDAIGDNMSTDMSFSEMKSFISYGTSGDGLDLESYTLEGYDYQPADIYYYQLDEESLTEHKELLQHHLELDTSNADSSTPNEAQHAESNE